MRGRTRDRRRRLRRCSIGGGSTTGLGKAIALRTDLPQVVVPTTYAGSEVTPILGETQDGVKTTQRSPRILPEVVIYDVDLTLTLPPALSATCGMNAIAHAVEALYAKDRNPIISLMAEEGIAALARASAGRSCADPQDRAARSRSAVRRLALRHLPRRRRHGAAPQALPRAGRQPSTCRTRRRIRSSCRTLPPTTRPPRPRRWRGSRARSARATRRAGSTTSPRGLGAPLALNEIGMPESGIERAAELARSCPVLEPAARSSAERIRTTADRRAFDGRPPRARAEPIREERHAELRREHDHRGRARARRGNAPTRACGRSAKRPGPPPARFRARGRADHGRMGAGHRLPDPHRARCAAARGRSSSCSPTRSASRCWSTRSTTACPAARPRRPCSARSTCRTRPSCALGADISRRHAGEPLFVEGSVARGGDGRAARGRRRRHLAVRRRGLLRRPALDGRASLTMRARFRTDAQGRFWFWTIMPNVLSDPARRAGGRDAARRKGAIPTGPRTCTS